MRYGLTDCIVEHIFDNLGISLQRTASLRDLAFQLQDTIQYQEDDEVYGENAHATLYGAEFSIEKSKFRMLLADFNSNETNSEYALVVKLEGSPTYGCYLYVDNAIGDPEDGFICFAAKPNTWVKASVAIQATFLAGMENLREINSSWIKPKKYQDLLQELKSFYEYQNNINDKRDEA